jgi:hypothetical protein
MRCIQITRRDDSTRQLIQLCRRNCLHKLGKFSQNIKYDSLV